MKQSVSQSGGLWRIIINDASDTPPMIYLSHKLRAHYPTKQERVVVWPLFPQSEWHQVKDFLTTRSLFPSPSPPCLFLMPSCSNWITIDSVHQFQLCYWDLIGCAGDRLGGPRGPFVRGPSVGDTRAPDRAWPRNRVGGVGGWQDGRMDRFPRCNPKPHTCRHTHTQCHNNTCEDIIWQHWRFIATLVLIQRGFHHWEL